MRSYRAPNVGLRVLMPAVLAATLAVAAPAAAMESQADFMFEMLGAMTCEPPPREFDLAEYRQMVSDNPELPLTRGTMEGGMSSSLAGGTAYGDDGRGSYMVGMQGILLDHSDDVTALCVILAHIGQKAAGPASGAIFGEENIEASSDGDFLGVFKLVTTDERDHSRTYATGTVSGGSLTLDELERDVVAGSLVLEGSYTPVGTKSVMPLSVSVAIPRAENVLEPVWTLERK
ncbi:hypothetical protein INQ41_02025 [Lysobacter ciconiae]|uniref:Uncharacterized protein n=1 Tax=Novilysobacter ciconiae TaxID=2781022 RepID=A0A7S6UGH9_9GAMM|nr:hypothetical protein [Lysobacter ciconiae]QOW19871.1 hypothetical protein INQ41_02025 [Lysobacter ciconiae]